MIRPFKIVLDNHENYFVKETIDISQDGTSGRVIVLKNITSFKELDVAKTNFIATISHELKIPLASSDLSIKLLQDERTGTLDKTVWVLNNFLTNAIKYSAEGGEVVVQVKEKGELVEFSVSDNGPGIASQHLPRVFDRFFKVPGSKSAGNGLGLAISKEFIKAQHGTIWVSSELASGCTFAFTLPRV